MANLNISNGIYGYVLPKFKGRVNIRTNDINKIKIGLSKMKWLLKTSQGWEELNLLKWDVRLVRLFFILFASL